MISKVSPLVTNAASNIERMVVARRAVSPGRAQQVGSSLFHLSTYFTIIMYCIG